MAQSTSSSWSTFVQRTAAPCAPRADQDLRSEVEADIEECVVVAAGELRHARSMLQAQLECRRATDPGDGRRFADIAARLKAVEAALQALSPEPPAAC